MTEHVAHCSCGQLVVQVEADPLLVSLCSCPACQRRTGSAFGVAVFFDAARVALRGRASRYERTGDSGHPVTFHFCPDCGSTVYWRAHRKPDAIAVALGCFAQSDFAVPTKAVYTQHMPSWVCVSLPDA